MAILFHESNPQDPEQGSVLQSSASSSYDSKEKKHRQRVQQYQRQQQLQQQPQQDYDSYNSNKINYDPQSNRFYLYIKQRIMNPVNASKFIAASLLAIIVVHRIASIIVTRQKWINAPITYIQRQCPEPEYERMTPEQGSSLKICITSLTDAKSPSAFQRFMRWRNFDKLLDLTMPNKQAYADRHGYQLFDHSYLIDTSRPPAWTKILAMKDLLSDKHQCDWAVWTDADTLIMNPDIKITDFLPADDKYDMLVATDKGWGYNSGVFFFRNTPWSNSVLDQWWNMTDFVRPPGLALSGDNAALKHLLLSMTDFHDHVLVPPRCTFNSFAKFMTLGQSMHIMKNIDQQSWYLDNEHYHKGDFIAHTPGQDNKAEAIQLLLDEITLQEKFDEIQRV